MLFQFRIEGLGEAGLCESDHFRAVQSKIFLQILSAVMLHNRVMGEFGQDFGPAAFRKVGRDQHKVQFAFVTLQGVASEQQVARTQDEREEAFNRFGRSFPFHCGSLTRAKLKVQETGLAIAEGELLGAASLRSKLAAFVGELRRP